MTLPGMRVPAPIGVYDHPADPDVPFLHDRAVDDDLVAKLGYGVTQLTDRAADLFAKIPIIG